MRTSDFDYQLPRKAIAQPPPRRDRSRLLVLDRATGRLTHRLVRDLPTLLRPGDLLVVNDTKVFRARLHGMIDGKPVELLLVRPEGMPFRGSRGSEEGDVWLALGKPGKRFRPGTVVIVGRLRGTVRGREHDGAIRIAFDHQTAEVIAYANRVGDVPTPPYVTGSVRHLADYQTAYARAVGSVAAPTAGFHLTPRLLRALRVRGVRIARVTLHVGLGTFQPIHTESIENHTMHAEWASVPAVTARAVAQAKAHGGRVVAVGTTTLRALEGFVLASSRHTFVKSSDGWVDIFIVPGFRFRVVDALLTNFHLPKSSLLVLVSAFAAPDSRSLRGRDMILRAYRAALRRDYRFYSFGDAMLIQ